MSRDDTHPIPRPAAPFIRSRRHLLYLAGTLAAGVAALVVMRLMPPGAPGAVFYPECLLYRVTGLSCSGCGGTRAAAALCRGDLAQALAYNALAVCLWPPLLLAWLLDCAWQAFAGRPLIHWNRIPWWSLVALAVLLTVFMVLRNLPWPIFQALAPHPLAAPR